MHLRNLISTLRADFRPDTERGRMVRSTLVSISLKVGSASLAFISSLLYARTLGPHDYGLYAYVLAWSAVLTILSGLGLAPYLVREGAKNTQSTRWLNRWADRRVYIAGAMSAVVLACAALVPAAAGAQLLFLIAAPLPGLNSLSAIRQSLLQVKGLIARSQWPQLLFAPSMLLITMAILWLVEGRILLWELITTTLATAFLPVVVNELQLRNAEAVAKTSHAVPVLLRSALPFMWLGGLYLLVSRTDLIMLGALKGAHDAGIYAVASRPAELVTFFMAAANATLAPKIASLHQSGEHTLLQRLVRAATRRIFLISAPVVLFLIVGAQPLLQFLYGSSYAGGAIILQLLTGAQFFVILCGPLGTILDMTGNEKLNIVAMAIALSCNVALNFALIPSFGAKGAALATCLSIVLARGLLCYAVHRYVGLSPIPFTSR
jgi:O-antigen/teichoic acid export membrane protein